MARTAAVFGTGTRVTDYISLGVITKTFPSAMVEEILENTGKSSIRQRALPAHVVVYYTIAMALFMQVSCREVLRCLFEGLQWLRRPRGKLTVAGKSGISKARSRLGVEPVKRLHDRVVVPIATERTVGARYRQWTLVSLDGSTLDVADTSVNVEAFGRPSASRGSSAFPQIRFVSLVENGSHVLFGSQVGGCRVSEAELAENVIPLLRGGMLCLADRYFFSYSFFLKAAATGADLLWRVRRNARLPVWKRFADGSYLTKMYPSEKARRHDTNGMQVRAIDYRLQGIPEAEPIYRVVTTILDPDQAPAPELAALYHERWEIETAFDELKTHLRGERIVLRSKTPELVLQEFYGLMMAHFAIRGLMHEAALKADADPDQLSYVHAVRVVRRKLPTFLAFPPSGQGQMSPTGLG